MENPRRTTRKAPGGRGAGSDPPNRFESLSTEPIPDHDAFETSTPDQSPTHFHRDTSRTVLAENHSPDLSVRHSLNPYRGCEHGCIYCYARPTDNRQLGLFPEA